MSRQAWVAPNSDSRPNSLGDQRMTVSGHAILLEDRLAIVACIVDDCAEIVANGETVPETVWPRLRLVAMCAENDLSVWRQLPDYRRARKHIRAVIYDILDQLGWPR